MYKIIKKFNILLLLLVMLMPMAAVEANSYKPGDVLDEFVKGDQTVLGTVKQSTTPGYGAGVTPAALVGQILGILYGFLGVIALVLIVYAGMVWLFAQGNQEKISKAQGIIKSAIIGLIVLFSAYTITAFIIQTIGG